MRQAIARGLGEGRHALPLGQVLATHPIAVLAGPTLPAVVWRCEGGARGCLTFDGQQAGTGLPRAEGGIGFPARRARMP